MNEDFTFVVRHRAAPQGSKTLDKGAKGHPFMREASNGVHPFRKAVRLAALDETGRPRARFDGPVFVGIVFEFRQAKSNVDDYPTGQNIGDLDKLTRSVLDALTMAEVIEDDRYVVGWLHGGKPTKIWGPEDRVIITVRSAAVGPPRDSSVVDFSGRGFTADRIVIDEVVHHRHAINPFDDAPQSCLTCGIPGGNCTACD